MNKLAIVAALLVSTSFPAMAAPFCLQMPGGALQCIYADGNECSNDANKQNGACVPNPGETAVPISGGVGEYCMILPAGSTRCGYADGIACSQDALKQHGVCTKRAGTIPQQVPDSFVPNAG